MVEPKAELNVPDPPVHSHGRDREGICTGRGWLLPRAKLPHLSHPHQPSSQAETLHSQPELVGFRASTCWMLPSKAPAQLILALSPLGESHSPLMNFQVHQSKKNSMSLGRFYGPGSALECEGWDPGASNVPKDEMLTLCY